MNIFTQIIKGITKNFTLIEEDSNILNILNNIKNLKENTKISNKEYYGQYLFLTLVYGVIYCKDRYIVTHKKDFIHTINNCINTLLTDSDFMMYDKIMWKESPTILNTHKTHLTYISNVSLAILYYVEISKDIKYNTILNSMCEDLYNKMQDSYLIHSFPKKPIWVGDNIVGALVLYKYGKLFNNKKYLTFVSKFIKYLKDNCLNNKGILYSIIPTNDYKYYKTPIIKGSLWAYSVYFLLQIDYKFGYDQYQKILKYLSGYIRVGFLTSGMVISESLNSNYHKTKFATGDGGIIVDGLGSVATLFTHGCAKLVGDTKTKDSITSTILYALPIIPDKYKSIPFVKIALNTL